MPLPFESANVIDFLVALIFAVRDYFRRLVEFTLPLRGVEGLIEMTLRYLSK